MHVHDELDQVIDVPCNSKEAVKLSPARKDIFSLPAELRNQIYELVIQTSSPELNIRYGRLPCDNDWRTPLKCLATCTQIRHEMLAMFWERLTIVTAARWQSIHPVPVPFDLRARTMEPRLFPLMQELLVKMGPAQCSKIKRFVVYTPWKYLQDGGGLGWPAIPEKQVLKEMQLLSFGLRQEALELRLER